MKNHDMNNTFIKKECQSCQTFMADALWADLSEVNQEKFQSHLKSCAECEQAWAEMQQVTAFVAANPPAVPEKQYWNTYWDKLEDKLVPPAVQPSLWQAWLNQLNDFFILREWQMPRRLALASLLIIGGIFIGRNWPAETVAPVLEIQITDAADATDATDTSVANEQTLRYLDRSRILLSSLVNFEAGVDDIAGLDITYKQKISDQLLVEAEHLMTSLDRRKQGQVRRLITDLTRILQQISNLESEQDILGLELVQDGVDHQGLMLKINIEALRAIQATPEVKPRNDA